MTELLETYECKGNNDDLSIQNLIKDFIENDTINVMRLVISGIMGLQEMPIDNTYINLDIKNIRGAICHLDLTNCIIPKINTPGMIFIALGSNGKNINIIGLGKADN